MILTTRRREMRDKELIKHLAKVTQLEVCLVYPAGWEVELLLKMGRAVWGVPAARASL